ncbi:posterior protein-like [Hyla sarda]|uniref:posterior protein-like n=1 Tax=Hyla sarda TaxID=327740 RepID=UPI0024C4549E|nr:posterior protein-like [Hyla sarda]
MELVEKFVEKHASAKYQTCVDGSLGDQFLALRMQCQEYNGNIDCKKKSKKWKKEKLGNEILLLMKIKEIAEEKETKWQNERRQMKESLDKIAESVLEISAESSNELGNLKAEIEELTERNKGLVELAERYELKVGSNRSHLLSLENKISQMEVVIADLEGQLSKARSQLVSQEQHIRSLTLHKCKVTNICTISSMDGGEVTGMVADSPPALTIQDRLHLCKVIGECNTSESPITLSNRFEAVVKQYHLDNKDAWSLLRAWLPGTLAVQLTSAHIDDNDHRGEEFRRKELQRVLGGRDIRGEDALRKLRFRRCGDPVMFCNDYLSLYKCVYNCPEMSQDDTNFLYSMANRCNVDYTTRLALRNTSSHEKCINILRDWCEGSGDRNKTPENISVVYRPRRKWWVRYCYKCGRPGHIKRYCETSNVHPEPIDHSSQQEVSSVQPEGENTTQNKEVTQRCEEMGDMETDPVIFTSNSPTKQCPNVNEEETKKQKDTSPCEQQKAGINIPMYNPWGNLPFLLFLSWSQIALPLLLNSSAQSANMCW